MTMWLDAVYTFVAEGDLENAIDLLFERVDDMLCEGRFDEVNALLPTIDLRRLDSNLLIGLMSVTLAAKAVLPHRAALVQATEAILMETEAERIEPLMSGLR